MSYLKIANKGEMEKEALTLLGGTTKRGDTTKIGMFGSGNKYALAYLLRNRFEVRIFSGLKEIEVKTVEKSFRDNKYDVITIDGMETSITTESGPQWEFWHAMREIYTNALDEGLIEMNETAEVMPFEGETHFYVKWNDQVQEFFSDLHKYFSKKRIVYNSNIAGECFVPHNDNELIVYRKGIRCYIEQQKCIFHYNFDNVHINETRVVASTSQLVECIHRFLLSTNDDYVIEQFYSTSHIWSFIEHRSPGLFREVPHNLLSDKWLDKMPKKYLSTQVHTLLMSEKEIQDCHVVQPWFFDMMRKRFGDKVVPPFFKEKKKIGQFEFRDIKPDAKTKAYIDVALDFFKEVKYDFTKQIRVVKFHNSKTVGMDNEDILLSESVFDKGRSHLIKQILYLDLQIDARKEESDATHYAIEKFVAYMAEKNSYLF